MLIRILNGKGAKDRYVPIDTSLLQLLRKYYKEYKPKDHLFNGQKSNQYSAKSIQSIIKAAANRT